MLLDAGLDEPEGALSDENSVLPGLIRFIKAGTEAHVEPVMAGSPLFQSKVHEESPTPDPTPRRGQREQSGGEFRG